MAEQAHRLALADLHVDVAERPEVLVRDAPEMDEPLLQGRVLLGVEAEALGDLAHLHCRERRRARHRVRGPRRSCPRAGRTSPPRPGTAPRSRPSLPPPARGTTCAR